MIRFGTGNLLESDAEALVNTVNTVGVMGKGIALMFKEAFPANFKAYAAACKAGHITVGKMFVTERADMYGPKWIINFPTKRHWRHPSKLEWVREGLHDLKKVLRDNKISSVALPPLGAGNGGLDWSDVKREIVDVLGDLQDVDVQVFEPTRAYQNVAKRDGAQSLTPARAIIAELVRRYWVLDLECTLLEVQKLAWFAERVIGALRVEDPLKLEFQANRYGPYADNLRHLLNSLDGSYLHCEKRLGDAGAFDVIWFDQDKRDAIESYLKSTGKEYLPVIEATSRIIDGFESPLGMEALATIDWLLRREQTPPTLEAVRDGVRRWPGGAEAAKRKTRIFDDELIEITLSRLRGWEERVSSVGSGAH